MQKLTTFIRDLSEDGIKALGVFSWLLSITFTVCRIFDAVPVLRAVDYAWALLPITIWLFVAYVRRWMAFMASIEAPRPPAMSLTPMTVMEIAKHLYEDSRWGWDQRLEVNYDHFVKSFVPFEMRRAAREHQVRFTGVAPNSSVTVEVDRIYWETAIFHERALWEAHYQFFSTLMNESTPNPIHYQFGRAPRAEVFRTWPPASLMRKAWVRVRLSIRLRWYAFSGSVESFWHKHWRRL